MEMVRPVETVVIPAQSGIVRLSDLPVHLFATIASRKGMKKAIAKGLIRVDGRQGYSGDHISGGETVEHLESTEPRIPPLELRLPVLFEDEHLAVIHKPSGLEVSGNRRWTLTNALPYNLAASSQPDAIRPLPVHRLDYGTSGAVLVGRTASTVIALNRMFEVRAVSKTYLAITIGAINDSGEINRPVDAREAVSSFTVLERMVSDKYGGLNLLLLHPITGRRHQLRKHLSGIGNPILGDRDYGIEGLVMRGNGIYLHALSLRFDHPITGSSVQVQAPVPAKFIELFPRVQEYCR